MQKFGESNVSEMPIQRFLRDLQSVADLHVEKYGESLSDWMEVADTEALKLQSRLEITKKTALWVTLISIALLAALAVLLRTPAPQVLCPFAVFLMILFNDRQRKGRDVFRFTSLRLLAETLRIIQAVQNMPTQLAMVLASRSLSTHAVVELAAAGCEASKQLISTNVPDVQTLENSDPWTNWMDGQKVYYANASVRERGRAQRARKVFNLAFGFVGLVGAIAGIWSLYVPAIVSSDNFRIVMALTSAIGSSGLAYINNVRDKKAFDQSFDYEHMTQVYENTRTDFESVLVSESMSEHVRWALRMASHFKH